MSKFIRVNLAHLRATRGKLSQRQVAEGTGIGQKTLSALETGASKGIEFMTLLKLCDFFKCTFNDLLVVDEEADNEPPTQEGLKKADELIARGLRQAMDTPAQTPEEIWAEFDALRERMQNQQTDTTIEKGRRLGV